MQLTSPIVFFLPLSCWVWNVESQNDIFIISVANGGYRGDWGETKYCPTGGAKGFSLKVSILSPLYTSLIYSSGCLLKRSLFSAILGVYFKREYMTLILGCC